MRYILSKTLDITPAPKPKVHDLYMYSPEATETQSDSCVMAVGVAGCYFGKVSKRPV
jgi:hypothetical protein